jgi:hypothetical protein
LAAVKPMHPQHLPKLLLKPLLQQWRQSNLYACTGHDALCGIL